MNGVVIETDEGRHIMPLHRGSYHSDVSPFPAAFIQWQGRNLLVHGVDWNRVDVSDPWTGEILTERSPTSYRTGERRPAHYLDYFHGRLFPSPDSKFIADDGWAWHPVGIIQTWNLFAWLKENRWESEDGTTRHALIARDIWDSPMCWINETTLAVWGYGEDETAMIPAVCLFDAASGNELDWFPGPEVAQSTETVWSQSASDYSGRLFFDRYLFAVSEKFGVGVWDIADGARLHQDVSFAPVAYHPGTKEFLTLLPDGTVQLSRLIEGDVG